MTSKGSDYLFLFLPLLLGGLSSWIAPVRSTTCSMNKACPPGWAFAVVWTVLYVLIGLSWFFALRYQRAYWVYILFSLLIVVLFIWPIVYKYTASGALVVLLLSLFLTFFTLLALSHKIAVLLLSPLFIWLMYALLLNYSQVAV